ncbi:Leucyl aminopeptidase yscIV [Ceratobasidium sp. 394]|nr:Leucyl aminopeptidase yscIV [Ceratobasidium sp. 394]
MALGDDAYVPAGCIDRAAGEALAARLASGESINAILDIKTFVEERYSSNVIASSKAGNLSNVVFIGAHLDSVTAGPGINDTGSGSVAVLELAIQLAKYRLKNAVRFAWWTAEEYRIVGSQYYVDDLSEAERKKIALCINLDMVASPNYVYAIYDGDGSAGINPGPTPPGSDGVGIPAGGLFTGAEGIKTDEQAKLFGGKAGEPYDPNYHAKGDTYDNLNFDAFLVNAKASGHAIATFIQSTGVVDAEKTVGLTTRQVAPAPNDNLPAQGMHLCMGDLA